MKKKKLYHKLVRDRIPEIIQREGKDFSFRQVKGDELRQVAMRKLREEVVEFIENPCAEKAADVVEILEFICYRIGIHQRTVEAERNAKYVERGGFDMGLILEWVEEE